MFRNSEFPFLAFQFLWNVGFFVGWTASCLLVLCMKCTLDFLSDGKIVCLTLSVWWHPFRIKRNMSYDLRDLVSLKLFTARFDMCTKREHPNTKAISHYFTQCKETGNVLRQKLSVRLQDSDKDVDFIRGLCMLTLKRFIARLSLRIFKRNQNHDPKRVARATAFNRLPNSAGTWNQTQCSSVKSQVCKFHFRLKWWSWWLYRTGNCQRRRFFIRQLA
jgi:hypothetical protein